MVKWSYLDLFGCKVVPAGSCVEDSVTDAMLQGRTVQPEDLGGSHKSIETARFVSTCSPSSARTVQPQTNDIDLKTDVSLTNYHLLSRPVAKEVEAREAAFLLMSVSPTSVSLTQTHQVASGQLALSPHTDSF